VEAAKRLSSDASKHVSLPNALVQQRGLVCCNIVRLQREYPIDTNVETDQS
jgi:hypothetical protein